MNLEDMTFAQRFLLTVIIVLVILFALAAFGYFTGGWDQAPAALAPSPKVALCSDETGINDKINELAFQALDDALRKQIEALFSTWMKDDTAQPERAATGVRRSALAYIHARKAILEWNIPPCTPERK